MFVLCSYVTLFSYLNIFTDMNLHVLIFTHGPQVLTPLAWLTALKESVVAWTFFTLVNYKQFSNNNAAGAYNAIWTGVRLPLSQHKPNLL